MHKIFKTILHAEHIPDKIRELEKAHKQKNLSTYLMNRLAQLLVQSHVPADHETDILERYSIHPQDIRKGILCPRCQAYPMIRQHGSWICPQCSQRSKEAHKQAIQDYLLLFHQITNRQCRDFLGISSIDLAKRLLVSMNLPYEGTTTNRTYFRADLQ